MSSTTSYNIGLRDGLFFTTTEKLWYEWLIFFLNVLMTPILLPLYAIQIYLWPCFQITVANFVYWFIFEVLPCSCLQFTDSVFPPNDASLGKSEVQKLNGKSYEWKRCNEITGVEKVDGKEIYAGLHKLFSHGITPEDICQGALGDCWLLSALAALSEYPNKIMEIFLTDSYNPRGIYYAQLFNHKTAKFERICVDDHIPCRKEGDHYRPMFTQTNGNECWVLILEKMFAKFVGSYSAIDGGFPIYALHVLTGDPVTQYQKKDNKWQKLEMHISNSFEPMGEKPVDSISDIVNFYFSTGQGGKLDSAGMFDVLYDYSSKGYILAAGTDARVVTQTVEKEVGLVSGHAYTILGVYKPKLTTASGVRLLKLRNPWGQFEWKGEWSDTSDTWKKFPGVKLELQSIVSRYKNADDGVFYMSWDDFLKYFCQVDVCMTTNNTISDLQLDTCEDFGKCGGFLGCVLGCLEYWLCCVGLYKLWRNTCCLSDQAQNEQNGVVDVELEMSRKAISKRTGNDSSAHDNRTVCQFTCCSV